MKKRSLGCHLSKDAGNAPDINRTGVAWRAKQDLGSTVPQCHDLSKDVYRVLVHFFVRSDVKLYTACSPRVLSSVTTNSNCCVRLKD